MHPVEKSEAQWRAQLSEQQFRICRLGETEMPGSGAYWRCHLPGVYHCVCCGQALFKSEDKYDSHCGWPSFTRPVDKGALRELADLSHGMQRIEVRCAACDAHLGHVFDDGPPPLRLRYCINSLALHLREKSAMGQEGLA